MHAAHLGAMWANRPNSPACAAFRGRSPRTESWASRFHSVRSPEDMAASNAALMSSGKVLTPLIANGPPFSQ